MSHQDGSYRKLRNCVFVKVVQKKTLASFSPTRCILLVVIHPVGVSVGLTKKPTVKVKCVLHRTIVMSVTPPADAPASAVIKYLITYGRAGENRRAYYSGTRELQLLSLMENTQYHIRVQAKYNGGEYGPMSDQLTVRTKTGNLLVHCSHEEVSPLNILQ